MRFKGCSDCVTVSSQEMEEMLKNISLVKGNQRMVAFDFFLQSNARGTREWNGSGRGPRGRLCRSSKS